MFEFDSPEKESAFEGKSDRVSAEYKVESEVSIQNTTVGKTPSNTQERILSELKVLFEQLKGFSEKVTRGRILSARLYSQIQAEDKFKDQILKHLKEMDRIDEEVSSRKGLTEILGMSIQRTVLMITEGYEGGLSLEEKKNERLGIAKKSLLLYQGLEDACKLHSKLIGKTITILRARLKT